MRTLILTLTLAVVAGCAPSYPPMFVPGDLVVRAADDKGKEPSSRPIGIIYKVTRSGGNWTYHVAYQGGSYDYYAVNLAKVGHMDWAELEKYREPVKAEKPSKAI